MHVRIQKICQRSPTLTKFIIIIIIIIIIVIIIIRWEVQNTTKSGLSSARQRNAI